MAPATDTVVHEDPPGFLEPPRIPEAPKEESIAETLGVDDPLRPREGRDLVWKNVNMTLNGKGDAPPKKILDGVWGEVPKRQVTAIMGPSGSGKVKYCVFVCIS